MLSFAKQYGMNTKSLLELKNKSGETIVHLSAARHAVDVFKGIIAIAIAEGVTPKTVLEHKTQSSETILHLAVAQADDVKKLEYIVTLAQQSGVELKSLLEQRQYLGCMVGHLAAAYGSTHTLCYILDLVVTAGMDLTLYINQKDTGGLNRDGLTRTGGGVTLVHYAIANKNHDVFYYLIDRATQLGLNLKALLEQKTNLGSSVFHIAAEHKRVDIICYLLKEHPSLAKQCWCPDKRGKSPQNLAPAEMSPKPDDIRDSALLEATHHILNRVANPCDLALLLAFRKEWRDLFPKIGLDKVKILAKNPQWLPESLHAIVDIFLLSAQFNVFEAFALKDNVVSKTTLNELLMSATHVTSDIPSIRFFTSVEPPLQVDLRQFLSQISDDTLNIQQLLCLKVIINDYERHRIDRSRITDLLSQKLLSSSTLSQLSQPCSATLSFSDLMQSVIDNEYVPHYTSQTCPACTHVSKENRRTQAEFACVSCDYVNHADLVGAINILRAGHAQLACEVSVDVSHASSRNQLSTVLILL
ncbi:MAG: zinc ribbon domain-containing protein [Gammaproteobacteria bacterium]|nr:zinc ribbon domain-containing protein [Gammaproteobacteria bacterium]